MIFQGEFLDPDETLLKFSIGAPEPSKMAPFQCSVLLHAPGQNRVLIDNYVLGEDPFQALYLATSLNQKVSGWSDALKAKSDPSTPP